MKVPSGTTIVLAEYVKKDTVTSLLSKVPQQFNGYIAITSKGVYGVETGLLLVDKDIITHACYKNYRLKSHVKSGSALELVLELFSIGGVVDVVDLTVPKLKLTQTFNEDHKIEKEVPLSTALNKVPDYSIDKRIKLAFHSEKMDELKYLSSAGFIPPEVVP